MDYKRERHLPVCLECGDTIRYGRTDKRFCCEECKNRHHNRMGRESRSFRRKMLRSLDRNYEILDRLLSSGVTSADMTDLMASGFSPNIMTSYRIVCRRTECSCYDIKYIMTTARLTSISKIQNVSLPLHADTELSDNAK